MWWFSPVFAGQRLHLYICIHADVALYIWWLLLCRPLAATALAIHLLGSSSSSAAGIVGLHNIIYS